MYRRSGIGLALALAACDAQAPADYRGEPLGSVRGGIEAEGALEGDAALLWWTPGGGAIVRTPLQVRGEFPAGFSIDLFEPPPAEALLAPGDERPLRMYRTSGERVLCRGTWTGPRAVAHVAVVDAAGHIAGLDEDRVLTYDAASGYGIASLQWAAGDAACVSCADPAPLGHHLRPHPDGLDARLHIAATATPEEACDVP